MSDSNLEEWSAANQRLLQAEFARLRAMLGEGDLESAVAQRDSLRQTMPALGAADALVHLFGLSEFERDLIVLVAGIEMDARLNALSAQLTLRPFATFGLALARVPDAHWSALSPVAPLRRWRLLDIDETVGLTSARLRMDERVLHYIGGLNDLDHRLQPLFERLPDPAPMSGDHCEVAARAVEQLRSSMRMPALLLAGDDQSGQQDVAISVAASLGTALYRLRVTDIPNSAAEQGSLATLWQREAALLHSGLLITCEDDQTNTALSRFIGRVGGVVIVAGRDLPAYEGPAVRHTVDRPDAVERRRLWELALGAKAETLEATVNALASQYRLSARRIVELASLVSHEDGAAAQAAALHRETRRSATNMPHLAQRIETRAQWKDLVLPETQLSMLQQVSVHARHRLKVHHSWGFAGKGERGLGIATLFWGDSGTGKTLAAEVLANELELDLYRIDLSAVVSKYIGDTEKNLRRLFDAAEDSGAILLFDEADALFGKRSDVKDSHDRYANIEVSYLLQRMEAYSGLAILTTNHKAALDGAFQRRLRFVVHFPFPDQVQREAIWRTVFPSDAPVQGIDYPRLARLNVAGGSIRNIALSAAFFAAEAGTPLGMAQLLRAAHLEAAKRDKPYSDAEIRGWV